ncbi:ABC transporter substrate-binding protein [Pseudonocardia spinosispora]|uniref:ABC transporter substrate-binding protein n=1 Tax=Pseudonocardia spinosispora TaxID=103441 RepID=UPI0004043E35|nr:ABC transporter substrate-binding protein [Pseudonocardia spinosispora]
MPAGYFIAMRVALALASLGATTSLAACGTSAPAARSEHVVTSMSGVTVQVPNQVGRIAEQFPAHTTTDIMLGVGDKVVAIPQNVKTLPFLSKVFPRVKSIPELFHNGGAVNMEDLLQLKPDVVSAVDGGATLKPFQEVGLPAVDMNFNTFQQLTQSMVLAGQVYGGDAVGRAQSFTEYVNAKVQLVRSRLASLPSARRPSVVHIASYPPLVVDGGTSLIDEWIKLAGGTDAASPLSGASGTHVTVTMEQLLTWNPDVLIVETPGGDQGIAANSGQSVVTALANTPGWQNLRAVQNHRVYLNPQGLYPWDRFGPEEALQVQWAAKTLHPELFTDLDIRAEARAFYQRFFAYDPSDSELDQIFQVGR